VFCDVPFFEPKRNNFLLFFGLTASVFHAYMGLNLNLAQREAGMGTKVALEIEGCTDCPHFMFTAHAGCYCKKLGLENMKDEDYKKFNRDFHNGALKVPEWCPIKA
jgi:hypothetical protein